METTMTPEQWERLKMAMDYTGPWEHLERFLLGIRKDNTFRWEIPLNPTGWKRLLDRVAGYASRRDTAWRGRLVQQRRTPHHRWRSRP